MNKRKRTVASKSKSNKKQKVQDYEWPTVIAANSPFELIELTETILSLLIVNDPISVLKIANTYRRNNALVRSWKFWHKCGYDMLTDEYPVPIAIIKVLLSQFRFEQLQKETYRMQREMSILNERVTLPKNICQKIGQKVTLPDPICHPIDARAYLAYHTQLTTEACALLLQIKSLIGIGFFQIADFVSLIECSKDDMQRRETTKAVDKYPFYATQNLFARDIHCSVVAFEKVRPSSEFHLLYDVSNVAGEKAYLRFQIWKKFLPKNRSVLLILENCSMPAQDFMVDAEYVSKNISFFLKYDAMSGLIEECSSFAEYTRQNFAAMPADVWHRVLCAVSEAKTFELGKFPSRNMIVLTDDDDTRVPISCHNVKLRK